VDASQGPEGLVVNEFSEELLVMPPECNLEYVIEIVHILLLSIRDYRMTAKQLAELKDQIKELLEKGYICPSSPPWGAPIIFIPKKDGTQ
jgi:hypothetical protein